MVNCYFTLEEVTVDLQFDDAILRPKVFDLGKVCYSVEEVTQHLKPKLGERQRPVELASVGGSDERSSKSGLIVF